MGSTWTAHLPDLTGKAVIVAGRESPVVVAVVRSFAASGSLVAVVCDQRSVVDEATEVALRLGVAVHGVTGDPTSGALWSRVVPHVEQRLGPIDVAVAVLDPAAPSGPGAGGGIGEALAEAVLPDMAARHRGVLVEVMRGAPSERDLGAGVRHRIVSAAVESLPDDVAAAALVCASDVLTVARLRIQLT